MGGGWSTRWLRRRGRDEPNHQRDGEEHRLRRPDGTELQVEFYGPADALPLVLTHGWGCDSTEWYYTNCKLSDRYRLIVWDLPGLGRSSAPANNDYSLEKMAGDLDAVIRLAGDRPVILAGHSIGGMILLTYCRLYPEALGQRVRGLILAHTTYTNPVKTTSMASLYTALQKPVLEPLCHLMIWLSPVVWLLNCLSYLNGSAHRSSERSAFSGNETRGQLDFYAAYTPRCWPAVIARGMLAMFRYDATAKIGTIGVPVLVVVGDGDKMCTPEASEFMQRSIPACATGDLATGQARGAVRISRNLRPGGSGVCLGMSRKRQPTSRATACVNGRGCQSETATQKRTSAEQKDFERHGF